MVEPAPGAALGLTRDSLESEPEAAYDAEGRVVVGSGGDADATLAAHTAAGIDVEALAAKLQSDAATSFVESWNDLMAIIDRQSAALTA